MRYVVNGVDGGGKHKRAVVEAADEAAARTMVQGVGLTITHVERLNTSHSEAANTGNGGTTNGGSPGHLVHVPDYPGLHIGAWVLRVFGIGAVAFGLASLYPIVRALMYERKEPGGINPADLHAIEPIALTCFALFALCAVLWLLASIAVAIRDIARNSFRH